MFVKYNVMNMFRKLTIQKYIVPFQLGLYQCKGDYKRQLSFSARKNVFYDGDLHPPIHAS